MHKKLTLIAGLLLLLGLPHLTSAQNYDYIPSTEFFSQFANPRTAGSIAAQQQAESEARRNAAYAAAAEENNQTVHTSAGDEETVTNTNSGTEYQFSISPETLRALERIEQQKAENELRAQALELLGADFSLHSGADLSGTTGKGDTGKGTTGKGTPTFLPTSTTTLSGTGYSTGILLSACAVVIALSLAVLRRKQTVYTA